MTPSKLIVGITILSLSCGCGRVEPPVVERVIERCPTGNSEEN